MRADAAPGQVAFFAAAALVLAACAEMRPPRVGEPIPTARESSLESQYQSVFQKYSAHAEVYAGLDTRLFAGATYQTPTFREARLRRQMSFQSLSRAWLGESLDRELKDAANVHEFILGAHVNDTRYEDFDKPTSIWRIALVTSAGEVAPLEIRRVGRADLNLAAYYPYLDVFWTAYRVRFPRLAAGGGEVVPTGTEKVMLRLSSTLGKVEMSFPAE